MGHQQSVRRPPGVEEFYESLEDSDKLPPPELIAAEITENLENALEQFGSIEETLRTK